MPEILDYGGYLLDFELNEEFLHGKRVLDLGAGARLFAYDAIDHSLCQTVSLDENSAGWQSLNLWAKKQLAKGKNPTVETYLAMGQNSVEAKAQVLPFPAESFDIVFSRSVVPQMLPTAEDSANALAEIIRVLAVDGSAFFYPIMMEHWTPEKKEETGCLIACLEEDQSLELELVPIIFRETGNPGHMLRLTKLRRTVT
ncbi:hypothetical protein A3A84_01695 [Candidatus Collierbacteria bacterium RIFCSPLOWO2_01_FULL_50_23]|uniref:Methyltransferase type 11 domain-containing protein n=2 Tax=Candidatus Collieribacteriota TaxID=1752725 RepID=A0A1F5ESI5_9BACT|nr:MAG: hypothetical protein A3D09_00350 [Candidatus Collierbacteria bacterium RIFCSPHIGHO2_02_FULL_49_10]OGD72039.1 MAG: hypothetical protein A2703_01945 [Candidatus Collierbacteria bacterium RIFCSPHIGHO2_01_FULL_50_25]OGD73951.1 MAG: hypothetical protein A3A84_01695 [Candidatus Collierbacteria bacterium RIFCSPLOWO2_01_FULL_50_23]